MSCGWNIFCHVLGDPAPAAPRVAYNKALADLKAARLAGDQAGIQSALSRMQTASNTMRNASNAALSNVATVDTAVSNIKKAASFGSKSVMIAGGVLLLLFVLKK